MKKHTLLLFLSFLFLSSTNAQNIYQKVYNDEIDTRVQGASQTLDGGLIQTGIIDLNGSKIYVAKTDCKGDVEWSRTFDASTTIGNVYLRAIETFNGDFMIASNAGQFQSYNMALIRLDENGGTIWHKTLAGSRDDTVHDIVQLDDGDFLLAGSTNSWGTDKSSSTSYKDAYIARVDGEGEMVWSKTVGNKDAIDEAHDIHITNDGHAIITGRYIDEGAFFAMLLKMDLDGNVIFLKTFGKENHRHYGLGIMETSQGKYMIVGGGTINKEDHQSWMDIFVIRTDEEGNILWSKTYTGTGADRSDIGTAIIETNQNSFVITAQSMSFPTDGFVPNKHLAINIDPSGFLFWSKTFNSGGSHYTLTTPSIDGDVNYIIGFSNHETTNFSPHITRTGSNFQSGCGETDRTDATLTEDAVFTANSPEFTEDEGGSWFLSTIEGDMEMDVAVLCESIEDTICAPLVYVTDLSQVAMNVTLYPNPAQDILGLNVVDAPSAFNVHIFNNQGQAMMRIDNLSADSNHQFYVTNLSAGLYFLHIEAQGQRQIQKFSIIR